MSTFLIALLFFQNPSVEEGWPLFSRVEFVDKFFKSENTYYLTPVFNEEMQKKQGKMVELSGFYIPFEMPDNTLIISKNPYASCFFCGGAGPETVAEVTFKSKIPKLELDQRIRVRGKLRLNDSDVNHMCFQLYDAEFVE